MKSMKKYFVIFLLVSIALTSIVLMSGSSVTALQASPTPTPTATTTPTFASFFECIFGVKIFPGADPIGTYTINVPTPPTAGQVNGHVYDMQSHQPVSGVVVYLNDTVSKPLGQYSAILGKPFIHKPVGSYLATTDANGYYEIDNVAFGQYGVYYAYSMSDANQGYGSPAGSANPTVTAPVVVVDIKQMAV